MKIDLLGGEPAVIIGLMSGTSVDGIDAAVLEIWEEAERLRWRLLSHSAIPWAPHIRTAILDACRADAPLQQITLLDFKLGEEFAQAAAQAANDAGLPLNRVSAIASHGQTVWHQPPSFEAGGAESVGTCQIGEPAVIASRTGCLVVADFRTADMAVGGQGAPLVPFADHLLFSDAGETRAVQNLGGIANVTLLAAGGELAGVVAFDTGPGNMVMDALVQRVTGGALNYDRGGSLAAAGRPDRALLADLMMHPYFSKHPPKSTGREQFGEGYAESIYRRAISSSISAQDLIATAAALTAETIVSAYGAFLLPRGRIDTVILGGGGTLNPTLVSMLSAGLAPARIVTHSELGMPDTAKEAAAFAFFGYFTLRGRPCNVPSATGARQSAVLGKIAIPPIP